MLDGEKTVIKNGLKKGFIAYQNIRPELSAIHTKLCADKLEVEEELLFLLGNGYARELENGKLNLFNSTFINDLCGTLGIYLEEFTYLEEETFFNEVKRNSIINIAPPMIHVRFDEGEYLAIVCKVYENHTYDIISPIEKKVVTINKEQIIYEKPWYMMNSPRFMNPVFRSRNEVVWAAIYRLLQKNYQMSIGSYQNYYNYSKEAVARGIATYDKEITISLQVMFLQSLKCIEDLNLIEMCLDEYKVKLEALWEALCKEEQIDTRTDLAMQILRIEDEVWSMLNEVLVERKWYA